MITSMTEGRLLASSITKHFHRNSPVAVYLNERGGSGSGGREKETQTQTKTQGQGQTQGQILTQTQT